MTETCGAEHPVYRKVFCCRLGDCQETPHTAPIRRGQWVTWLRGTSRSRKQAVASDADAMPLDVRPTPRALFLENGDYGNIGSKSKGRCWYCGVGFSHLKRTLDHVVPRSKGGPNDPSNLVFACQPCNTEKASMSLEAYRQYVQQKQRCEQVLFYGERMNETIGFADGLRL